MKGFVTLTLLLMFGLVHAQPKYSQEEREKIKELKKVVFARVLDLTDEEGKVFWPIYDAHEIKTEALREKRYKLSQELRNSMDDLSDAELEEKLDALSALRTEEAELFADFYQKVKRAIPIRKVALLHKAEKEFKRELLRKYSKNHQDREKPVDSE